MAGAGAPTWQLQDALAEPLHSRREQSRFPTGRECRLKQAMVTQPLSTVKGAGAPTWQLQDELAAPLHRLGQQLKPHQAERAG
jgi:hypothetical protein